MSAPMKPCFRCGKMSNWGDCGCGYKGSPFPSPVSIPDPECVCRGNWRLILKEEERRFDKTFHTKDGREWTFVGLVHASDDYYYLMWNKNGETKLLTCVGSIEAQGFTEGPAPTEQFSVSPCEGVTVTKVGQGKRAYYFDSMEEAQDVDRLNKHEHKWDRAGERCEICGDKDWMTDTSVVPLDDEFGEFWREQNRLHDEQVSQFDETIADYERHIGIPAPVVTPPQRRAFRAGVLYAASHSDADSVLVTDARLQREMAYSRKLALRMLKKDLEDLISRIEDVS